MAMKIPTIFDLRLKINGTVIPLSPLYSALPATTDFLIPESYTL
jgi:hypothetical protein